MAQRRVVPGWLPYVDLVCAAMAGVAWYLHPEWGPWPLVLVLAPWAARWILTGRPTRRTPFDLPLVLFLATAGMGVWAAFHRDTAWAKFWIIVGSVAVYYAIANLPAHRSAESLPGRVPIHRLLRLFIYLYTLFGVMVSVYFLWTNNWTYASAKSDIFAELGQAIQSALPSLSAHLMQPNVVGGVLAMIIPFQLATFLDSSFRWCRLQRSVAGLALLVTLFSFLLTISRGAWLALAAGLCLWFLWNVSGVTARPRLPRYKIVQDDGRTSLDSGRIATSGRERWWRFLTLVALLLTMIGATLLLLPGGPREATAMVPGQNQLPSRLALWHRALYLVQDTPLTGGGLGTFRALDSAYSYPIVDWIGYRVYYWVTNYHSHNLWIDVALEQGVFGLLSLLWLQGTFVAVVRQRRLYRDRDKSLRLFVEAAVISALVTCLHALVDDVPYGSRATLLFFIPMAIVVSAASPSQFQLQKQESLADSHPTHEIKGERMGHPYLRIILPVLVVGLGLTALTCQRSIIAVWQSNLGALAQARAEVTGYQDEGYNLYMARTTSDISRSVAYFEAALVLDPDQATANLRLGLIWLGRGKFDVAIPLLERAYQQQPGRQAARQALAEAYLAMGRLKDSADLWEGVDEAKAKLDWLARQQKKTGNEEQLAHIVWILDQLN